MIKTFINITLVLMLTLAAISCSGHSEGEEPAAGDDGMVNFSIAIYAGDPEKPESSRAGAPGGGVPGKSGDDYYGEAATKHERIRTLRAIILRPGGRVEHNVYLQNTIPSEGLGQYSYIRVKVIGGEKKTVYLFANEASLAHCGVDVNLNDYTAGTTFPAEQFSQYQLSSTAGQPLIDNTGSEKFDIPMTEAFDVDIRLPQADGTNREQSADLFVTRATVKFSFHFHATETPSAEYSFSELAIESLGNREYLMPDAANVAYVPAKYPYSFEDRYITDYAVPSGAENQIYIFHPGEKLKFATDYVANTVLSYEPQLYFAETKLTADAKYILKLKLAGDADYCAEVPLPNLPSLPRNTHVKVNVTLANSDVRCTVDVLPYTAVPLNPSFGFDELLPRPPKPGDVPPWLDIDPDDE